jgi:hypothetical protein
MMTNRPNGIRYSGVIQQKHETHSARAGIVAEIYSTPSSKELRKTDRWPHHHLSPSLQKGVK